MHFISPIHAMWSSWNARLRINSWLLENNIKGTTTFPSRNNCAANKSTRIGDKPKQHWRNHYKSQTDTNENQICRGWKWEHAAYSVDHGPTLLFMAGRSADHFPWASTHITLMWAHGHGGWLEATVAMNTMGIRNARATNWLTTELLVCMRPRFSMLDCRKLVHKWRDLMDSDWKHAWIVEPRHACVSSTGRPVRDAIIRKKLISLFQQE